jgi:hypothetical protein
MHENKNVLKINFFLKHNSFGEIPFVCPCRFCGIHSNQSNNNLCIFCNKMLNYLKENDIVLYDLRDFIYYLGLEKEKYQLSWYDFLEFESELLKEIENNQFFFYHKERLSIFIDFGCLQVVNGCKKEEIFSSLNKIYIIAKKFFMVPSDLVSLGISLQDIDSFLNGVDKKRFRGIKVNNKKIIATNSLNRNKIKTILLENSNFLN